MKYPMEKWKWLGMAGHLCIANKCRFHLHTKVGPYTISTVGAYYPFGNEMEEVAPGREYETFVYKGEVKESVDSGRISLKEDAEGDPYKADKLAEEMHMEFCKKYAE
tara:strand:- start:47282 stop:47602 length:321 start_codon:yes stop_codon:yes gene_type:complete